MSLNVSPCSQPPSQDAPTSTPGTLGALLMRYPSQTCVRLAPQRRNSLTGTLVRGRQNDCLVGGRMGPVALATWPAPATMGRMSNDHSPPGGISTRLVSFSADFADSPRVNDYDSFAEAYAATNENNLVNAYYERPAMLALAGDVAGRRILDAGCGSGPLLAALRDRGAIVTGIDKSAGMLEVARRRLGDGAELQVAELGGPLPFPDDAFEDVTASLVLHYLEDWGPALAELRRVLKPSGRLIVSVNHPFAENL